MSEKNTACNVCGLIQKGDTVLLRIITDLKGKICFKHISCADDLILPGEIGDRASIRFFSPNRNCTYDFSLGDVWKVKIEKVHRTDIFTKDEQRIIYIRVNPIEKLDQEY